MFRLNRIFKNYNETGSLNEQINLYGFIGPNVFLTKTGEVGVILEVRGVDYECLDAAAIDGFTKRLESALKLFDENYCVYQYLFKRNNETIPYQIYGNPIVDTAIKNRIAYLQQIRQAFFPVGLLRRPLPGISGVRQVGKRTRRVPEESEESSLRSAREFLLQATGRRPRAARRRTLRLFCCKRRAASSFRSAIS